MKECRYDAVVIGAGAAGMASALSLSRRGYSCVLVDREEYLGGILLQCVHNGFGLQHFGEELTGPEFAFRFEREVISAGIPFLSGTTVLSVKRKKSADGGETSADDSFRGSFTHGSFNLLLSSGANGVIRVTSSAVILAMGSRERNRGNIRIAGDRPSGVFTAGLVQHLLNIDGYVPGKRAVIIGSGDIGLIMARRLTLSGVKVEAVVEIQSFPSGLTRNIVQCLEDYSIPLYLSHATLRINGKSRVTGIEVAPLENGAPRPEKSFRIPCDTVLLSVGLVCENELSAKAGVALNPVTNGPIVDSALMTSIPGIFASGNVLHIHDLVDRVVEEADRAGSSCADWLDKLDAQKGTATAGDEAAEGAGVIAVTGAAILSANAEVPLRAGSNVRYTVPSSIDPSRTVRLSLRSMVVMDKGTFLVSLSGCRIFEKKLSWVKPGEMISIDIPPMQDAIAGSAQNSCLEISLIPSSNSTSDEVGA